MNFIWAGERQKYNTCLIFTVENANNADTLRIGAVDFYQVFIDGKLTTYGPARTASGYVKVRSIDISGKRNIVIKVLGYNFACYAVDCQQPFFGAELIKSGKIVGEAKDFDCFYDTARLCNVSRFSPQRGCMECFDFTRSSLIKLETYVVNSPTSLEDLGDFADYSYIDFNFIEEGVFKGFDSVSVPDWYKNPLFNKNKQDFDVDREFLPKVIGYQYKDYCLAEEHSGFIGLKITAKAPADIYLCFEEIKVDGKWCFRRSGCNEVIYLRVNAGETAFLSTEPYALRLLKIVYDGELELSPYMITVENKRAVLPVLSENPKLNAVLEASKNSFKLNAVDIFTDCPSRERAGWLCDSYFLGIAERFFTGGNEIEKSFIENFIIAVTPEIPPKMLPKCFPSEHATCLYIPNWAMWFILEVESYFGMTGDSGLVDAVKQKVYDIIDFFQPYVNELGLLEDLESWVFVEWSLCNSKEYIAGVNFPSNMLFAYALLKAGKLYKDEALIQRGLQMQKALLSLSFDGRYFADNAIRQNGKLVRQDAHVTETCQYYALFTGICPSEEYKKFIIETFGPYRKAGYEQVTESNTLPGFILRFNVLLNSGEYARLLDEIVEYFYPMAEKTGTLWEHTKPQASCCHGFTSVIATYVAEALKSLNK